MVTLQFCKAHTYFIIYPNAKLGEKLRKETWVAGVPLRPAAGAEMGLDSPGLPNRRSCWGKPLGWTDEERCPVLQGWADRVSRVPLPPPRLQAGFRQHTEGQGRGAHRLPLAVGFGTLKGLDAQLCKGNIGPESLLARAAQESFCARAAEGFGHDCRGNTLIPLLCKGSVPLSASLDKLESTS